jgi:hypothetical protein
MTILRRMRWMGHVASMGEIRQINIGLYVVFGLSEIE